MFRFAQALVWAFLVRNWFSLSGDRFLNATVLLGFKTLPGGQVFTLTFPGVCVYDPSLLSM